MKRGQITVYMIVGVVILILFGLIFYYRGIIFKSAFEGEQVKISSVPEQFKDIQKQIEGCTDKFVLDSIYLLGLRGGYFDRDKLKTIDYLGVNITYLHYGKTNYMPSIDIMEKELTNYINENLVYTCRLINENIDINFGKVNSIVDIKTNSIIVKITWSIKLEKDTLKSEINNINLNYPLRLGEIRNLVEIMIKQQIKDKPQLCLTCMARTALDNNLFVNTYNEKDSIIFIVTDLKEVKDFDLYRFEYAGDYK